MQQLPFELVCAVQDLYDLYTRLGPRGPYRLSLFSDPAEVDETWPEPVQRHGQRLDELARGVSCLLANDLGGAAAPLIREFWRSVRALHAELAGPSWRQPAYFAFITHELSRPAAVPVRQAYRLFGEVLAVYLELICELRPDGTGQLDGRIPQLRRALFQSGAVSSDSAASASSAATDAD